MLWNGDHFPDVRKMMQGKGIVYANNSFIEMTL